MRAASDLIALSFQSGIPMGGAQPIFAVRSNRELRRDALRLDKF
jgi:hypothetical protein